MKRIGYVLLTSSALGCSLLAAGGCSSGSGSSDTGSADQVQDALNKMSPFPCVIARGQCIRQIRECVDTSCAEQEQAVRSAPLFSQASFTAIRDLQQCAWSSCRNACMGGTGGAGGASGGAGGAAPDGGVSTGGTATGGTTSAGGTTSTGGVGTGGTPETGGATSSGGTTATGGATSAGGTAGCGGTGGSTSTGGSTATGGSTSAGGSTATGGSTSTGGSTATGGSTSAGGSTATGGSTGGGGIDLTGTWVSHVNAPGTLTAPVVGTTNANIDIVLRLSVSGAPGGALSGTLQICRLNPVTTPNASSLVVQFTPAVLATLQTSISEPAFTAMVGQPVPLPDSTILTGVNAGGTQVDSDMDGNPGVTIPSNVGGILMLNAYTGLTIKTSLKATLTNASTITGTASFSSTGTVFGSDNPILTSGNINVTPSSSAIPFTAAKLAGDVPCSSVVSMFP